MTKGIIKTIVIIVIDAILLYAGFILSIHLISDDFTRAFSSLWLYFTFEVLIIIILNGVFRQYSLVYRYVGMSEFARIVGVMFFMIIVNSLYLLIDKPAGIGYKFIIVLSFIQLTFLLSSRFLFKIISYLRKEHTLIISKVKDKKNRVIIYGAGDAGVRILKEILESNIINLTPVCFIDDDTKKQKKTISGLNVIGGMESLPQAMQKYNTNSVIIAVPGASQNDIEKIIKGCNDLKCDIKILPRTMDILESGFAKEIRPVEVEDLLGRDPINTDITQVLDFIENKTVLVTGGGGSIGTEICRQISQNNPKELIILDIYENNIYDIEQELKRKIPNLPVVALVASVRDKKTINEIFSKYRPEIVFHAAAHKHVPLMETSPREAIKNNVFGTLNVTEASSKYGVKKFIMISTDKAVNPTNVMGATKRVCEMIVQNKNCQSKTEFVAVRFGNVLGSNGSVIPLFKKQIAEGGPVTVTSEKIVRFFMTIPEAVSLVLQAGAFANGGEIFVLDMGKPVKIYDLAANLIKLSGYTPGVDMKIQITGLRPGEKMYEELLMGAEGLSKTNNKLIFIGKPLDIKKDELELKLKALEESLSLGNKEAKAKLKSLVPTYTYKES